MKLVSKALAEVVNSSSGAEDTIAENADTAKEEDMMAVVEVEADMSETVEKVSLQVEQIGCKNGAVQ